MGDSDPRLAYREFLKQWNDSSPFIEAHSSGSTGEPKQLQLLKVDMEKSARTTVDFFGLRTDSVVASALPATSIATKMAIVRSVVADCKYLPVRPSNTLEITDHVDLLSIAPSQADFLINHPEMVTNVGTLLIGGSALSPARESALMQCGYSFYETYGMTETCSNIALRQAGEEYFSAKPGIRFSLDKRGCLEVHAPCYSFDGIVTNDMAELISPAKFRLLGRADNAINSGGIKIHPEILERELADSITCPFYVVGVPSAKWGHEAVLVVEGDDEQRREAEEILKKMEDRKRFPQRVVAIAHFLRTHTGKIHRLLPEK